MAFSKSSTRRQLSLVRQHCETKDTATLQHCNTATQLAIIHGDDAKSIQQLFTMREGAGVSQSLTCLCLCVRSDGVACTDLDAMKHNGALNELDEQYRSTSRRDFSVLTGSYPSSLISSRSPSPSALENPVSAAAKRYGSKMVCFIGLCCKRDV